jgi:hypothetical protein
MSSTRAGVTKLFDRLFAYDKRRMKVGGAVAIVLGLAVGMGPVFSQTFAGPVPVAAFVVGVLLMAFGLVAVLIGTNNMWKADEREQAISARAARNGWMVLYFPMTLWFVFGMFPGNDWIYQGLTPAQRVYFVLPIALTLVSSWVWTFSLRDVKRASIRS